jgi:hypothetical protein
MNDPVTNPSQPTTDNPTTIDQPNVKVQIEEITNTDAELAAAPEATAGTFDIQTFEATRAIVSRQADQLDDLKKQIKLLSEQLRDQLEGNPQFVEAKRQADEQAKTVKQVRAKIMDSQVVKNIKQKIADFKNEKGDLEDSLSGHLFDLYQTTGVMEFEDIDGNVREYKISAKLGAKKAL